MALTNEEIANLSKDGQSLYDRTGIYEIEPLSFEQKKAQTEILSIACSDLDSNLTTGSSKSIFYMPFKLEVTEMFVGLATPTSGSSFTTDVKRNGISVLSTNIIVEAGENTSLTAVNQPVFNPINLELLKGDKISVDFITVGSAATGKGHILYITGIRL